MLLDLGEFRKKKEQEAIAVASDPSAGSKSNKERFNEIQKRKELEKRKQDNASVISRYNLRKPGITGGSGSGGPASPAR